MRWISNAIILLLLTMAGPLPAADTTKADADEQILREARLEIDGPALLQYFRSRTLKDVDGRKIRELVAQLGAEKFEERERASALLVALGTQAEAALQEAVKSTDIEVVRRAEECLRLLRGNRSVEVDAAAVRVLARKKSEGTIEVLLAYLPFARNEMVADAVRKVLPSLSIQNGVPVKAVMEALEDKHPLRRAAAATALTRAGGPEQRKLARKLLKDADPSVRLRVGMALTEAEDKTAVPVLIELMADLRPNQAWPAENLLCRLAGRESPLVSQGTTTTSRKKCRDAWAAWWAKHRDTVDLAKLLTPPKTLGYTMVILLDAGVIMEIDAKGKERWRINNIDFPLDAELLPGGRVLAAEHAGSRVTERNRKGQIIWEKKLLEGPLVAQRLPNGNTFIATAAQLLEVNREGKEVFVYSRPNSETFRKATKMPNGDIAMVTSAQRFILMSAGGKEVRNHSAEIHTNGGRVDVLPNGHTLIPQMSYNKVVEYDTDGKAVWEAKVDEPIAAIRLPNGNTLVTTLNQKRAIEVDKEGKQVWEFKSDTRVTRAFRR